MTWDRTDTGLTGAFVYSLAVSHTGADTFLFAGTNGGVFLSVDNGSHWNAAGGGITNPTVYALDVSPNGTLFAGTGGGGVFWSTDNGAHWTAGNAGLANKNVRSFAFDRTNLFAGTYGGGVFLSVDNGLHWTAVNTGLTNLFVGSLMVSQFELLAGTGEGGLWRRALSDMITSAEPVTQRTPEEFSLSQNYPNPFNPNSEIRYQISEFRHVTLIVYDLLGRQVATLVNEVKQPGIYTVQFDGSNLASGVYLYRLHAGDFVQVKKLVLLK
jgi:hypothetical protein